MTVENTNSKSGPYDLDGATLRFPRDFFLERPEHLQVFQVIDGVATLLTTGFSVTGIGSDEGEVIFSAEGYPVGGGVLMLKRNVPNTQETDYSNQARVKPEQVELDLDQVVRQIQDLREVVNRSLHISIDQDLSDADLDRMSRAVIALGEIRDELEALYGKIPELQAVYDELDEVTLAGRNIEAIKAFSGSVLSLVDKSFVATGGQTAFQLDVMAFAPENVIVWLNKIRLVPDLDYTTDGSTLILSAGASAGDVVDTLTISAVSMEDVKRIRDDALDAANKIKEAAVMQQTTFLIEEGKRIYQLYKDGRPVSVWEYGVRLFIAPYGPLVERQDYHILPDGRIELHHDFDPGSLGIADFMVRYTDSDIQQIILGTKENADRAEAAAGRAEAAAAIVLAVNTASDMMAGAFVAGDVVRTLGYYAPLDGGAGTYLVRAVDDGFSIPLSNGLFASLRDDFDIRKFGIRDGFEYDQTEEIRRMVAYADDRVYEIDFLNYRITTPKIVHYTTSRDSIIMGMAFHKVHDLKNLRIANDKGETLVQGTSPVLFLPKSNGVGTFKFTNFECDPWVDDYEIISGEYDGMMLGFLATNHPDWDGYTRDALTGYSFDMSGLNFTSPAVSYNISLADIFSPETRLSNLTGEYLGLYVNVFTKKLVASRVDGVWRDDLFATEGRLLVTNPIHEEPEITGASVTQDNYSIFDCSCVKYTDGSPHVVYKNHTLGGVEMDRFDFGRNIGAIQWYSGGSISTLKARVNHLNIVEMATTAGMSLALDVGVLTLRDCPVNAAAWLGGNTFDEVRVYGGMQFQTALAVTDSPEGHIGKLTIDEVYGVSGTFGLVRSANAIIDEIQIGKALLDQAAFIEAKFKSVLVREAHISFVGTLVNLFYCRHSSGAFTPAVSVENLTAARTVMDGFYLFEVGLPGTVSMKNSWLPDRISGANATVTYQNTEIRRAVTFDPPSIAAGASVTTTITIGGVSVGNVVTAAFSNYNADIEIYAVVSGGNSVTVKFKNTGAGAVDLASGTLTVLVRK